MSAIATENDPSPQFKVAPRIPVWMPDTYRHSFRARGNDLSLLAGATEGTDGRRFRAPARRRLPS